MRTTPIKAPLYLGMISGFIVVIAGADLTAPVWVGKYYLLWTDRLPNTITDVALIPCFMLSGNSFFKQAFILPEGENRANE